MLTVRGSWIVVLLVGCRSVSEPVIPALRFALTTIDHQVLPRTPIGWPQAIEAGRLDFGAISALSDGVHGSVAFTITIAGQTGTTTLDFAVSGSILHIPFCAIAPTNCGVVLTALSGPVVGDVLELTYWSGGQGLSVFRFEALGSD